jgi:2-keto-4-pentenoate hydratase
MYTDNSDFYLGLSSTLPTASGGNVTEPSKDYNYSRVLVGGFTEPDEGAVKNINALTFPKSTGVWFEPTAKAKYWVLFDGEASSAHLLSSGLLDEAKTVETNTVITIEAETLSVTLTDYQTE